MIIRTPEAIFERAAFGYVRPAELREQKELNTLGKYPGRLFVAVWRTLSDAAAKDVFHVYIHPDDISISARVPLHRLPDAQGTCIGAGLLSVIETHGIKTHGRQKYLLGPAAIPHTRNRSHATNLKEFTENV